MYLQTFIPLFLAVHIPVENGKWEYWEYGLEYIFNVNVYVERPQNYDNNRHFFWHSSNVTYRLFCTPKSSRPWGRKTILNCRLRNVHNTCTPGKNNDMLFELLYNKMGIEKMTLPESTGRFDLHVLKLVAEQLDPATIFKDVKHVSRPSSQYKSNVAHKTIVGGCNINFDIKRQKLQDERLSGRSNFRIVPLLQELHINSNKENIIVNKTKVSTTCNIRTDRSFSSFLHKGQDCQEVKLYLDKMTNLIQIEKNSFVSSTKREGRIMLTNTKISEIVKVILEDIRPVGEPVAIVTT